MEYKRDKTGKPFSQREMLGSGGGGGGLGYKIPKASSYSYGREVATSPQKAEVFSGRTRAMVEPTTSAQPHKGNAPSGTTFQGKPVGFNTGSKVVGKGFSGNQAKVQQVRRRVSNEVLRDRSYKTGDKF